ncbi:hypothetical protein HanPSC8_Chr06g0253361 [Helianthus annuus]|nr:hypothetical protein HanPSC8_Chr06g0253361 [Helianthus annuus]
MGKLGALVLASFLLVATLVKVSESRVARKDLGLDLGGIGIGAGIGIGLGGGGSGSGAGAGKWIWVWTWRWWRSQIK